MIAAIIPDTLEGALILSLIDFILSFIVISFIGLVLAGFPYLNTLAAWLEHWLPPAEAEKQVRKPVPAVDAGIPPEHVAAIAAAVSAVLDAYRIVQIEDQGHHDTRWVAEGRYAHHTSHQHVHASGRRQNALGPER